MATAALIPSPKQTFLDSSGNPLSGGKVYTYAAGTTTPQNTFSDAGLSVANANPVILDSAGRAAIYLSPVAYKIVLKTSADVTVWTQDDVTDIGALLRSQLSDSAYGGTLVAFLQSGSGAVARTVQAKAREFLSVKDFGAVGDGVTNDTAAFAAAKTALASSGGVIFIPEGIYMIDSWDLTGDVPIQVRGVQGSYLPSTLTKGSIVRCRGTVTNFISTSGRFRSIHDVTFDGNGYAANVMLLSSTTTHYNFHRVHFIRAVNTTGVLVQAANAGNGEIDHVNFYECCFHGDPTGSISAATGFNLGGSNAFMNNFHDCIFARCTNGAVIANGAASFFTCDFLTGITYSCITITGGHNTIRIQDCYTEQPCTYFLYHSVTLSNGNKPLFVSGNMVNHATPLCAISSGQPVILTGNQFHAGVVVDNTARYRPVSIGNNFNGTANDYSGAGASNMDRLGDMVNGTQITTFASAVTITGLETTSTTALGSTTFTAGLLISAIVSPTALSGDVNNYNPTGLSTATTVRLDPNGAARNVTGIIAGVTGRVLKIMNISATGAENLVLKHQSGSSDAANRIIGPNLADHTIRPGGSAEIIYDGTTARWRVISA